MPGPRRRTSTWPAPGRLPDGSAASVRTAAPKTGSDAPRGAPRRGGTGNRGRHVQAAGRGAPEGPEAAALPGLLRGLRAGDLETVLLTVAMAADENRMPCADTDKAARILAVLARLAEHDAALPPPPDGLDVRPEAPMDAG